MTHPLGKPAPAPNPKGEDLSGLSFHDLKARFEASACEKESFALATTMYAKDFHQAMKLLPVNLNVYQTENSGTPKIDPERLNFDGQKGATSHEWSSALVAAKKLKLEAGVALEATKVDQVVDTAKKIYNQTRKEEPICRPM